MNKPFIKTEVVIDDLVDSKHTVHSIYLNNKKIISFTEREHAETLLSGKLPKLGIKPSETLLKAFKQLT